jgi:cytoskeletal protein RodZ
MQQPDEPDHRGGTLSNIVLLLAAAAVIGLGVWLLDTMVAQRDIDNCIAQGERHCTTLDLPAR